MVAKAGILWSSPREMAGADFAPSPPFPRFAPPFGAVFTYYLHEGLRSQIRRLALEEPTERGGLRGRRLAAQRQAKGEFDLPRRVVAGLAAQAVGKLLGLAIHKVTVEERQRLRRDAGDRPPVSAVGSITKVERFEHRHE